MQPPDALTGRPPVPKSSTVPTGSSTTPNDVAALIASSQRISASVAAVVRAHSETGTSVQNSVTVANAAQNSEPQDNLINNNVSTEPVIQEIISEASNEPTRVQNTNTDLIPVQEISKDTNPTQADSISVHQISSDPIPESASAQLLEHPEPTRYGLHRPSISMSAPTPPAPPPLPDALASPKDESPAVATTFPAPLQPQLSHRSLAVHPLEGYIALPGAWQHLVYAEIANVTSTMRRNARWSALSQDEYPMQSPLLMGFVELKRVLSTNPDLRALDAVQLLHPFLEVIQSSETTGPITGAALQACEKLLNERILDTASTRAAEAITLLATTTTRCKFEATDSVSDEAVLMRILQLLKSCLVCPLGAALTNEAVCQMMETAFSMCFQMRLSELLRRFGEQTLGAMIKHLFDRLPLLKERGPTTVEESGAIHFLGGEELEASQATAATASSNNQTTPMSTSSSVVVQTVHGLQGVRHTDDLDGQKTTSPTLIRSMSQLSRNGSATSLLDGSMMEAPSPTSIFSPAKETGPAMTLAVSDLAKPSHRPYGVAAVTEVLRFLISLLHPSDPHNTDTMRLLALQMVLIVLERCSCRVIQQHSSLLSLLQDDLCRHLFMLSRSENIVLLQACMRVIASLFLVMRSILFVPFEFYFQMQLDRLTGLMSVPAQRELQESLLNHFSLLSQLPSFMVDLYVNWDCAPGCCNAFEDLMKCLARNVVPEVGPMTVLHTLSFEIICQWLISMSQRIHHSTEKEVEMHLPSALEVADKKKRKIIIMDGCERFNISPKDGIKYWQTHGILPGDPLDPHILASFLKSTPSLSKKLLGEHLAKPTNVAFLEAFLHDFDFNGKRIDEALRMVLESFRLPGESQQIERIMEMFATFYFETKPADIATKDASFVLAYSIIMLNTDQHNPQVRRRMTFDDFVRNTRGVNDGNDFNREFLKQIFDAIKSQEIVMPGEHDGEVGFNYLWKERMKRLAQQPPFLVCHQTHQYDKDMFQLVSAMIIPAINGVIEIAESEVTFKLALDAVLACTFIAKVIGSSTENGVESHVASLVKMTGLTEATMGAAPVDVLKYIAIQSRAKYAMSTLVQLVTEHGNTLRQNSWKWILHLLARLFDLALLSDRMLEMEDFQMGKKWMPRPPLLSIAAPSTSLLSTLSSYLSGGTNEMLGSPPAQDPQLVEYEKNAKKMIGDVGLDEIFASVRCLDDVSLLALMNAFIMILTGNGNNSSNSNSTTNTMTVQVSHLKKRRGEWPCFLVEKMFDIVLQNRDRITLCWTIVYDFAVSMVKGSTATTTTPSPSLLLVDRLITGLIRLVIRLSHKEVAYQMSLDTIQLLKQSLSDYPTLSSHWMTGLVRWIKSHALVLDEIQRNALFQLIGVTAKMNDATALQGFLLLKQVLASSVVSVLSVDSFGESVDLLIGFIATVPVEEASKQSASMSRPSSSHGLNTVLSVASASTATTAASASGAVPGSSRLERGLEALNVLYQLHEHIPQLAQRHSLSPKSNWSTFWLPIISGLSQQCYHPQRDIRHLALTHLQSVLLLPDLSLTDAWADCFDVILFPLLDALLKPDVFKLDPVGMSETRIRCVSICCKIFLTQLSSEKCHWPPWLDIWMAMLSYIRRLMKSSLDGDQAEAIRESLKNMLWVMHDCGVLKADSEHDLWQVTWEQLGDLSPGLQQDLGMVAPQQDAKQ